MRSYLPIYKKYKAYTLIELAIVISIISILTATVIPLFRDFREKQELQQSVDFFVEQIELVRNKASSGAVVGPTGTNTKVWWSINTCLPTNNQYSLGSTNIVAGDDPSGFSPDRSLNLSSNPNIQFTSTSCSIFYFKRISGELYNGSGILNSLNISITDGTNVKTVTVHKSGKVEVN